MNDPVVSVNGQQITEFELNNFINELSLRMYGVPCDEVAEEGRGELHRVALDKLVIWELLFQNRKEKSIEVSGESLNEEIESIVGHFPAENDFLQYLEQRSISLDLFRHSVLRDLTVEAMIEASIDSDYVPTEQEVEDEYQRYLLLKKDEPKVRARHILISLEADADDQTRSAALKRICDIREMNDDFAKLAQKYSECSSSDNGGDLGWIEKGQMVEAFEEEAFSLEPGVVSKVVETEFGFHLIKVEEKNEQQDMTLEEARPRIIKSYGAQKSMGLLREWALELKGGAEIKFFGVEDAGQEAAV